MAPKGPRLIKKSAQVDEDGFDHIQFAGAASTSDPCNYKEAMKSADADKWSEAAKAKYFTLSGNHTWELVDLPPGAKAIGCGWVFKVKCTTSGSVERYKARIVATGYSQRLGVNYTEVFAPTFCPATLRMILALSAVNDLELCSVDISAAFTNGDLDEDIYMQQPEGFHKGRSNKVFRLQKSLYCQGNTIISVTRPPTKIKQKRKRREREKREKNRERGLAQWF